MVNDCVNDEMERMWKETVMIYFKVLYQNMLGGSKENYCSL